MSERPKVTYLVTIEVEAEGYASDAEVDAAIRAKPPWCQHREWGKDGRRSLGDVGVVSVERKDG